MIPRKRISIRQKDQKPDAGPAWSTIDDETLLTRKEAAAYLRVSTKTLERWGSKKNGPPYRVVMQRSLYLMRDLRAFVGVTPNNGGAKPK